MAAPKVCNIPPCPPLIMAAFLHLNNYQRQPQLTFCPVASLCSLAIPRSSKTHVMSMVNGFLQSPTRSLTLRVSAPTTYTSIRSHILRYPNIALLQIHPPSKNSEAVLNSMPTIQKPPSPQQMKHTRHTARPPHASGPGSSAAGMIS